MARREHRGLIILMAVMLVICQGNLSVIKKVYIIANCPHRIDATIGEFSCVSGGLIPKARTSVEMPLPLFSPTATHPEGLISKGG